MAAVVVVEVPAVAVVRSGSAAVAEAFGSTTMGRPASAASSRASLFLVFNESTIATIGSTIAEAALQAATTRGSGKS